MQYLYDQLKEYAESDFYGFHMPGHKRKGIDFCNPFFIDITEIEGFDNLHHAEGILKEAQNRASALYGAESTFFLVNGSTSGLLSAISACTAAGGKIIAARNCHKAVYHAISLRNLEAVYIYPQQLPELGLNGGLLPEEIENLLLKNPDAQAVVITSPTYDGIVSNVEKIAKVVHKYKIPLIVDEAHGAHFGLHEAFPQSSVKCGADVVIQSLHKTMPSLTQTALLHKNGNLVDEKRLKTFLSVYQTSSPSYVLMASIDQCIRLLWKEGAGFFSKFIENLSDFRNRMSGLSHLYLAGDGLEGRAGIVDFDRSKLIISVKNTNIFSKALADYLLQSCHIQMEMTAPDYVLGISTASDTKTGFFRLADALESIDKMLVSVDNEENAIRGTVRTESVMKIAEAEEQDKETVLLEQSEGGICGEYLSLYPPGIPLLVPGERITRQVLDTLTFYKSRKLEIQKTETEETEKISIVKMKKQSRKKR